MKRVFIAFFLSGVLLACGDSKAKTDNTMVKDASDVKPAQSEFADAKFTDMGKQMMQKFEAGDMDAWVNMFADNAVYAWSGGDSLAGKKAIADYWKNRRGNVIETIHFSNDIWLPIKVNEPQKGPDMAGIWLLNWYQVNVKYKAASKPIGFWIHTDYHFDANDKIDRAVQYIDMAPIKAAIGK
jgi:hypothetical protein